MKKFLAAGVLALSLAFTACTTFRPVSAGSGVVGAKHGEATAVTLFGLLPITNDCSMLKAAKNGGIEHVATVDQKIFTFLGLYSSVTTIVTGD